MSAWTWRLDRYGEHLCRVFLLRDGKAVETELFTDTPGLSAAEAARRWAKERLKAHAVL